MDEKVNGEVGGTYLGVDLHQVGSLAFGNGDMVRLVKSLRDSWVHVDEHVAVLGNLSVSLLHLRLDEVRERLANPRVDHVHDPLLRQVGDVLVVWEVEWNIAVPGLRPGQQDDGGERFILRAVEVRDLGAVQGPLHAGYDVLEKVDRNVVGGRQVLAAVYG
jgi:hypothetical protein